MAKPIRIAGAGVVSPFGASLDAFRDALLEGRSGIAPDTTELAAGCRSTLVARVRAFDPAAWIAPMKLRRMDATGAFAIAMARQAMDQAGYAAPAGGDDRAGVVLGTWSAGGQASTEYLDALFAGGPANAPALLFNSTVGNAAAGLVGLEWKLRGPNETVSQKEASGLAALVTAVHLLREGRADGLIAGGVDAMFPLFYQTHDVFAVMNAGAAFNEAAAPFSAARDGFVLGEGAYGVWLTADVDGPEEAPALGTIIGTASGAGTTTLNAWPGSPAPLVRAMHDAIDDAGLDAGAIDVVYASANASRGLDAVEIAALDEVFGGGRAVVTSIKGSVGECGAAGAAALVAALACGAVGRVPPIAGLRQPDPAASRLALATAPADAPGPLALITSVASGGAVECAVVKVGRSAAGAGLPSA